MENLNYLLPLISGILWGISAINDKYASSKKTSALHITFWYWFFGVLAGIIGLFIFNVKIEISLEILINTGISAILLTIYTLLFYFTLKRTELSRLSLLTKSTIIVYTFGGIYLYKESLSIFQYLGIILIFLALITINLNNFNLKFTKITALGILVGIISGIAILLNRYLIGEINPQLFELYIGTWIILFMLPFMIKDWIKDKKIFHKIELRPLLITSILSYIGDVLIFVSYSMGGYVSISNLIPQIRTPIAIIYGILFFHEKTNIKIKLIALLLFIIGIISLKY